MTGEGLVLFVNVNTSLNLIFGDNLWLWIYGNGYGVIIYCTSMLLVNFDCCVVLSDRNALMRRSAVLSGELIMC